MMITINDPTKANKFATLFQNLRVFTQEVFIVLEEEKLYIQCMDTSHISMLEISIDKSWFDNYMPPKSDTFGISTALLNKVFHTHKQGQSIELHLDDEHLHIHYLNGKKKEKVFKLKLMDIDSETLGIPEQEYNVKLNIETKAFKSIVDELSLFSDTTTIHCTDENIGFHAQNDMCETCTNITNEKTISYNVSDEVHTTFNLKYLQLFCQFNKVSDKIKIYMSNDLPLRFEYTLNDNSYVCFYLAPKMDDDEYDYD